MYSLNRAELTILVWGLASTLTYIKSEAKYDGKQQIFHGLFIRGARLGKIR